MGSGGQHRDQPFRRGAPEAWLLSLRDSHRRPAGPDAAVPCRPASQKRLMTQALISLVGTWGLLAIFVTMTAESAGVPISSEIVVPLGGALASQGKLNLVLVVLVASAANLAGSLIAFYLTRRYGEGVEDRLCEVHSRDARRRRPVELRPRVRRVQAGPALRDRRRDPRSIRDPDCDWGLDRARPRLVVRPQAG